MERLSRRELVLVLATAGALIGLVGVFGSGALAGFVLAVVSGTLILAMRSV